MRGGRRLDMAAGGEDEGRAGVGEAVGDRPDLLAVLELDVDDRDVEAARVDMAERVVDASRRCATTLWPSDSRKSSSIIAISGSSSTIRIDPGAGMPSRLSDCRAKRKDLFRRAATSRTASASCWTEKGLARKATLGRSIDLRSCSSA